MPDDWITLREFPNYAVNELGEFVNQRTDREVQSSVNQQGHAKISLYSRGMLLTRSVSLLVAEAFVPNDNQSFDTPIHLDGDLLNCRADNLAWRPRWFAIKFHKQFNDPNFIEDTAMRVDLENGDAFENMYHVCSTFGVHYHDVINSEYNGTLVFPVGRRFAVVY